MGGGGGGGEGFIGEVAVDLAGVGGIFDHEVSVVECGLVQG